MASDYLSPQEERVIQNEGKVIFAFGTAENVRDRTQRIYDRFADSRSAVDVQRGRYFTQSFRLTEGQPLVLRWAKALYHIAESIDVYIDEDQLLVGRAGKPGKYGLIYPELDGCFLESFVKRPITRISPPHSRRMFCG